jgi:Zn-dependent peptidase ImmA (M78 family)/transcriptional regulator with XRE-family HTH domain
MISAGSTVPVMARRITPARLTLARQLKGITQAALATELKMTPGAISQFEKGTSQPSPENLEQIAMLLKVNPAFLWHDELVDDREPFFRSLVRVPSADRARARAYAVVMTDVVAAIDRVLELPELVIRPGTPAGPNTSAETIEQAAIRARAVWGVPPGPIANVTSMAESRGVVVAAVGDFHPGIDAFTLNDPVRPIVVLCTDKGVATRRRFDLAHELGHIVLHRQRDEKFKWQEKQAHRFASALLMPAEEIRLWLPTRGDDLRALERVAHDWGVSMQAALARARDLGSIDETEYARGMKWMSAAGWRRREPIEVGPPEKPTLLQAALFSLPAAGTSAQGIADTVAMPVARVTRMLQVPEDVDDTHRGELVNLRE